MANLSGIEVYRAMLDIVYTHEQCHMPICILCFAINDIHHHDDQDLQKDNDTAAEQGKEQEAATTATKCKRKARDPVAVDDNDDNDGTTATDTPTRMIITRRSLKLRQDGQTVPTTVDIEAATNDENVPPAATTSTQQPNSSERRKVDSTTTTTTNNGTAAISQIQPPVTRAKARLPKVSGTSTRPPPFHLQLS
ncbi:hypothetical protein GQ42DRAFT_7944 [Ramicandelaber brevisporus]|nr:hypothetical protein GQ42DRAFT_7944 [Ramicandelaber brevisporus]